MTVSSCFPRSWCQSTPRRCFRESYLVSFPSKANQIRRVERKWKKGVQFTNHLLRLSSRIASCLPTNQSESKDGRTRGSSVFASASAFASVSTACSCKRRQSSALINNWTYVLSSRPASIYLFYSACSWAKNSYSCSAISTQEHSLNTVSLWTKKNKIDPLSLLNVTGRTLTPFNSLWQACGQQLLKASKGLKFSQTLIANLSLAFGRIPWRTRKCCHELVQLNWTPILQVMHPRQVPIKTCWVLMTWAFQSIISKFSLMTIVKIPWRKLSTRSAPRLSLGAKPPLTS